MQSIDDAEKAVSEVESALAQFDDLTAAVKAKTAEIATLQAEHQTNTADYSGDFKARLKVHSANESALVMHRSDLLTLQSDTDGQKRKLIALGQATNSGLQSLASQLEAVARLKAKELLLEHFDPRQVTGLIPTLISAANVVRAIPYIPALYREDESALSQLRGIRANMLNPIKTFIETTGLELDKPEPAQPAADVPLSAMAEPVAA